MLKRVVLGVVLSWCASSGWASEALGYGYWVGGWMIPPRPIWAQPFLPRYPVYGAPGYYGHCGRWGGCYQRYPGYYFNRPVVRPPVGTGFHSYGPSSGMGLTPAIKAGSLPVVYGYGPKGAVRRFPDNSSWSWSKVDVTLDRELRASVRAGDWDAVWSKAEEALQKLPNDPYLIEWQALAFFVDGDYESAAEGLRHVLTKTTGWRWEEMAKHLPSMEFYQARLDELRAYLKSNPESSAAWFVLGYHYQTQGHADAAKTCFERAGEA